MFSTSAFAAEAAPPTAKPRAAVEPAQREIAYAELDKQIGKRIIVHTKLGTVRGGVLTKYRDTMIEMTLDGGADLTVPANTIRSVSIPALAPDPQTTSTGDGSAKKN